MTKATRASIATSAGVTFINTLLTLIELCVRIVFLLTIVVVGLSSLRQPLCRFRQRQSLADAVGGHVDLRQEILVADPREDDLRLPETDFRPARNSQGDAGRAPVGA